MFSITFAVFNLVQPSRHRADVAVAIALNCKPHLLKAKKQSKRGAVCLSHGWNKKTHTLYINIAIRVEDNRFSSLLARFVWYVPPRTYRRSFSDYFRRYLFFPFHGVCLHYSTHTPSSSTGFYLASSNSNALCSCLSLVPLSVHTIIMSLV